MYKSLKKICAYMCVSLYFIFMKRMLIFCFARFLKVTMNFAILITNLVFQKENSISLFFMLSCTILLTYCFFPYESFYATCLFLYCIMLYFKFFFFFLKKITRLFNASEPLKCKHDLIHYFCSF